MALKDLFSFFSPDSTEKYKAKPHDPVKARAPLLRGIATARKQFQADEFKKPNRWFSVKNETVAFHPKLDGRDLMLNGVKENHMPSERFEEFLDLMEKEVNEGQFDEVIANHGKGNVDVHIGKAPAKRGTGSVGGGRSELANVRSSFGRSMSNGKSLDEAEASARAKGFDEALIAQVKEEKRAAK